MDLDIRSSPAATAAATSVRRAADRRALYRRSNTFSSLPLDTFPAAACSSGTEHRRPLEPIDDSPVREAGAMATEVTLKDDRTKPQTAGRTAVPRQGKVSYVAGGRRAQLCRKTSCSDLLLSTSAAGVRPLYSATATSGLVSGSSGNLLTKVKERIRDTVLQTTPEWPVVMQERRQRAAIQFEMRAAKMMVDEQRGTAAETTTGDRAGSKCAERKPFAPAVVDRKEAARAAFRKNRSASCEDTVTTMLDGKLHPGLGTTADKTGKPRRRGSPSSDVTGIICSSKDLQSIIELSHQETASDEIPTSSVHTTSADNVEVRSQSPAAAASSAVVNYQEAPDEPSLGGRRRLTGSGIENSERLTVEVHVGCSDTAAATWVSETKPDDNDEHLTMPFGANKSDDIPMSSLIRPESTAADEVVADCGAASATKLPEVVYDANPEVLGDAIQRHLQQIMLTASTISGMRSQVAAVAKTPPRNRDDEEDVSTTTATRKQDKSSDDGQTERRRNVLRRFISSVTKRRRSVINQGSSN